MGKCVELCADFLSDKQGEFFFSALIVELVSPR